MTRCLRSRKVSQAAGREFLTRLHACGDLFFLQQVTLSLHG
jgi:hypothetical protein